MAINQVKGTHDVLGNEARAYQAIEELLKNIAVLYAYNEVRTPVIEYSELFQRGVGESSDIVRKEMYTFLDKGERSITLRPEFTAGIMRSIVSNKLYATNELPLKCYYLGPVFRYERPQLGRYRQFNQFGVESVGHGSYLNDVESIALAYTALVSLGLQGVTIKINSLGDDASRDAYRNALKEYFGKYIDQMCSDCKERFELNPLRILDCKVEEDRKIVEGAPKMSDFLSKESESRFNDVLNALRGLNIPYEVDDSLVRGLDYYSETVFEFHYVSSKGINYGALGAGGHYDKLVKEVGGPDVPGVGFSFGIERLYSVLADDQKLPNTDQECDVYVMPLGENAINYAFGLATTLRVNGYITEYCFDNVKLGSMFKRAEKKNAKCALIIGENEINEGKVVIKNMTTQEQQEVIIDELIPFLDSIRYKDEEECCDDECCCGHHHDHDEEEHECCCGHHHDHDENHECCGKHNHHDGCCHHDDKEDK